MTDIPTEKPALADVLRKHFAEQHVSARKVAQQTGIEYERLKKSLQRNRFNESDITTLQNFTGLNLDNCECTVVLARKHRESKKSNRSRKKLPFEMIDDDYDLINGNTLLAEHIARLVRRECDLARQHFNPEGSE